MSGQFYRFVSQTSHVSLPGERLPAGTIVRQSVRVTPGRHGGEEQGALTEKTVRPGKSNGTAGHALCSMRGALWATCQLIFRRCRPFVEVGACNRPFERKEEVFLAGLELT